VLIMQLGTIAGKVQGRARVKHVIAGVAALALLLPVPAFALTFLGPWSFVRTSTGGAPLAVTSFVDTPLGGTELMIDMGSFLSPTAATSEVTATREFVTTGNRAESVFISQAFATAMQNANLSVNIDIQPRTTGNLALNPILEAAGGSARLVNVSRSDLRAFLGDVRYRVTIVVRYAKEAGGRWNNTSPHRFTFVNPL
jgi:hypothetical protein